MEPIVSFISCVNDLNLYNKCIEKINDLNFDKDLVEIIKVENANSLTSGYNKGMREAHGKYKVYLHQDTYIENKDFIKNIISIFEKYPSVGLIGMIGTDKVHLTGVWSSGNVYGEVLENSASDTHEMLPLSSRAFDGDIKYVQVVDGLLLASQYDLPWRSDLFTGWDFYDASQCLEFLRHGYRVCVPQQNGKPWVIHDCGELNLTNYDRDRKKFLKEYSRDLFVGGRLLPALHELNKKTRPYQKKVENFIKRVFRHKH